MKKNVGLYLIVAALLISCSALNVQKNLSPEDKDFLSTVRYIMTKQEKKEFLDLAPSERPAFIEEFWKKRDRTPLTEVNEYKDEYLKRVKEAKHLFRDEGGASGWLQDRGRIYILLGPPEQREAYPRGENLNDIPVEYWHYGFHVLTFVDYRKNGNYELREGPRMLAEISRTEEQINPEVKPERAALEFDLDLRKAAEGQALILVSVPYDNIWLSAEGNEFKTTLELSLSIFDSAGNKVRDETKTYPISLAKDELEKLTGQDYLMEIPVELEPGEYRATIALNNITGQTKVKKTIKFTIPLSERRAL